LEITIEKINVESNKNLTKPTIVSVNWGGLGDRVLSTLNCYILSIKLECNFQFAWNEDFRVQDIENKINIFSKDFQDKHLTKNEIKPEEIFYLNVSSLKLGEAKELITQFNGESKISIKDFQSNMLFLDEDLTTLRNQYKDIIEMIFDKGLIVLLNSLRSLNSNTIMIHGRFGDLLDGPFCQYVPTKKYLDTISLRYYINNFIETGYRVTFVTDTNAVKEGLNKTLNLELSNDHKILIPKNVDKAIFDLLLLSSAWKVFANVGSSFSILASLIGNYKILDIQEILKHSSKSKIIEIDLDHHYAQFDILIRGQLQSRDLCNFVRNNFLEIDFSEIRDLLRRAYLSDPEYIYGACCWSILEYIDGNYLNAKKILLDAESQARKNKIIFDDPLFVVLFTKCCFLLLEESDEAYEIRKELFNLNCFQFPSDLSKIFISGIKFDLESLRYKRFNNGVNFSSSINKKYLINKELSLQKIQTYRNITFRSIRSDLIFYLINQIEVKM
jgi:hypothetical protein